MAKYISIPTEIEAFQYTCPEWTEDNREPFWDDNSQEVEDWIYESDPKAKEYEEADEWPKLWRWVVEDTDHDAEWTAGHYELYVAANDSWLPIENNEWIIRDSVGLYPCKDEIFRAKYREVEA